MIKVVLLADNLTFGGVNRYCLDLVEGLRAYSEVHCFFIALDSHGNDWLLQEARTRAIDLEVLPLLNSVGALRRILIERQIDVLHSQAYRSNLISRFVVYTSSISTRLVCTAHGINHFATTSAWRTKVWYMADYLTMHFVHRVIAVSAATERQIARWVPKGRLVMIHNGTFIPPLPSEDEKAVIRRVLGISEHAKVICFVGRFSPQKGIAVLVEVMRVMLPATKDVVFLIVGDGPLRPQLEMCANEFGAQVILAGPQRDVHSFYIASDVLLLPSCTEGLPMVLIEAFAYGLPAVASDVGGVSEVLRDGYSGFLCRSNDAKTMSQRLRQILEDDALRLQLGVNARETAVARYSLSAMVEATYQLYRSLTLASNSCTFLGR